MVWVGLIKPLFPLGSRGWVSSLPFGLYSLGRELAPPFTGAATALILCGEDEGVGRDERGWELIDSRRSKISTEDIRTDGDISWKMNLAQAWKYGRHRISLSRFVCAETFKQCSPGRGWEYPPSMSQSKFMLMPIYGSRVALNGNRTTWIRQIKH